MLLKRALATAQVVSLESGVPDADAAELDPMEADQMIDEGPHEAEDAEAAIHKLHTAGTALEELHDMVDGSITTGGLNSQGAHAVGIALEHILETLGLPQPTLGVSLEDFDQDSSDGPTKLVLESISETMSKVWKATMEFIDKMIQWFKDFIGDNLGTMSMLTKRAEKIKSAITHVKEWKVVEIHDKTLCSRLYSPDVAEKNIVPAYHDAMQSISESFNASEQSKIAVAINSSIARLGYRTPAGVTLAKNNMYNAVKYYGELVFGDQKKTHPGVPTASSGRTVFSTPTVLGNVGWYMVLPSDETDLNALRISSYHGPDGAYEQLRSLTEDEVKHVLVTFKAMEVIHKQFKLHLDTLNGYRRNLDDFVRGTSQNVTHAYSEYDPYQHLAAPVVRAMFKLAIGITGSSYSHVIRLTRDMFRLCEISLKVGEQHALASGRELVPA